MTRYFCDQCGVKVTKRNCTNRAQSRVVRRKGLITVEVMVARNGTWNAGEFCLTCVLDCVAKGKPVNK